MVHAVWAAVSAIACLYLIFTRQTGHPPPIVLVPYVLVAWGVGHGLIWAAQRLAARGRSVSALGDTAEPAWPIGLRLALVGTGVAALIGIIQVVGTVLKRQWYPFPEAGLWLTMLLVSLVHAASFAGLLMRRRWSRFLSATLTVGWAGLLGKQIAEQLTSTAATDTTGVLIAAGLMLLLLLFAAYLGWSREARAFLVSSSRGSASYAGTR
jgi:hypothetical protein